MRGIRAVFFGPPGAGKGTQALGVAARSAVIHVSTGDMLREHVANATELGTRAKTFMDAGKLVPDELIISMVEERLGRSDASGSFILDGFPRTLPQAESLDRSLKTVGRKITHVIFFRVSREALVQRLSGRRTCSECGAIWNVHLRPTARDGICDTCGGPLRQRSDDCEEAVARRLEVYDMQTRPLLEFYSSRSCLVEIDAGRSPDQVSQELELALSQEAC